ncbi:MAG: DUF4842 domain-containing protein [Prevotella sp.]|nr:DUF4842 domain-containing protein [Prevotella sp.]
MKKFVRSSSMVAMAASAIFMCSCSKNFDFSLQQETVADEYAKGWENAFGAIDSNQDWNLATQVTMKNPMASTNASSILVYDAMPGKSTTQLIGQFNASAEELTFDCTKGTTSVYIVGKDAAGKIIAADYYPVSSTKSANKAMTRAGEATTSLGAKITEFGSFHDAKDTWNESYWDNPHWHSVQFKNVFDLYNLNNVSTSPASSWKISDIVGIVGQGGVFNEQGKDENGNCNRKRWENQLKPSEGAEYVMESDGPIEISFMYGGTIKFNKFGYLYYKDGASEDEILKAPRYILMDDGRPQGNITVDGNKLEEYEGMKLPSIVDNYEKYNGINSTLVGTTYKLAYFGEDGLGEGSYIFPQGTHVVFFIIIGNNNSWRQTSEYGYHIRYSLPWMNRMFYYKQYENHPSYMVEDAAEDFVTYKWGGQIVMGVEDEGGDDDMNDILFFIKGNVNDDDIPEIGEEPKENSWIIACEDLGDTDDYDFNDVVFKVSHVSGQKTATVTPLAAGGTLETWIVYNNKYLGETHQLLGAQKNTSGSYPMINTTTLTATATPQEVTVPENYTVTNNMGGFSIIVKSKDNSDSNAVLITAPSAGTAPQMFCVPSTWAWPTERTKIQDAYPDFANWSADSNNIEWYNNATAGKVIGGQAQ